MRDHRQLRYPPGCHLDRHCHKHERESFTDSVHEALGVLCAFSRPKDVRRNSKRPNRMMTAVLLMSAVAQGSDDTHVLGRSLRRVSFPQATEKSPECVGLGTCPPPLYHLYGDSHHTVFGTMCIGDARALLDRPMMLISPIVFNSCFGHC